MSRKKLPHKVATNGPEKSRPIAPVENNLQLAINFFKSGQLEKAKKLLQDILKFEPTHTETWYATALISAQENSHQFAIKCLQNALTIDSKNLKYLHTLGNLTLATSRQNKILSNLSI